MSDQDIVKQESDGHDHEHVAIDHDDGHGHGHSHGHAHGKGHRRVFVLGTVIVIVLLLTTICYQVDFKEIVLVKTFGQITQERNGHEQAGLWFKLPYPVQSVVKYPASSFVFEDTTTELQTLDKQNLLVTVFCTWRIAEPRKFHNAIGTVRGGEEALRKLVGMHKGVVVSGHNLTDFVNTDKTLLKEIERDIQAPVAEAAKRDYGIEVVSLGVRNLGLTESISKIVTESLKKEREKDVEFYKSQGEAKATAIRSKAELARDQILAFAQRKASDIRTEGDRASAEYYSVFRKNEQLSMYLRSLESLKLELQKRAVILLDGSELPAVRLLREAKVTTMPAMLPESTEKTPK